MQFEYIFIRYCILDLQFHNKDYLLRGFVDIVKTNDSRWLGTERKESYFVAKFCAAIGVETISRWIFCRIDDSRRARPASVNLGPLSTEIINEIAYYYIDNNCILVSVKDSFVEIFFRKESLRGIFFFFQRCGRKGRIMCNRLINTRHLRRSLKRPNHIFR